MLVLKNEFSEKNSMISVRIACGAYEHMTKLLPEEKTMVMVVGKQYLGSMSG